MSNWIPHAESGGPVVECSRFVARQPIVDRLQRTFGYELLFRSGWENCFCGDGESASNQMIDNAVSFGLESLVGDTVPFVNCTRNLILKRLPTLLPKNAVLEILEDTEVDRELLEACRELRALGYSLAIDDFDFDEKWEMLISFVDMIKLDFRSSTAKQRANLMFRLKYHRIRFVAEKIETRDEFRAALDEGFHLFQGYFFQQPSVLAQKSLTAMVNRVRFVYELSQPTLDRDRMLRLTREEPSISLRVLRMANSVAVSCREPITSLRTAISLIGDDQFRKLALLALTTEAIGTGSLEPLRFILQRARFCELVAQHLSLDPSEMYLLGMLSIMCSALRLSAGDLISAIKLRPEIAAALAGTHNSYRTLLDLAASYEEGRWESAAALASSLGLCERKSSNASVLAHRWTESIMAML